MSAEATFRAEWEILHARRERARRRWRGAVSELKDRARDPLGMGSLVREHPLAAAGIGAVAGALLGGLFLRGAGGKRRDAPPEAPAPHPWKTLFRDAAMGIAVPWVLKVLKEKFSVDIDAAPPPAAPAEKPPSPTAASGPGNCCDSR